DRTVFSITVMGAEIYVVTSPDDVLTVYKNTNTTVFDYNAQIKDILGIFGFTSRTMNLLFDEEKFGGKSWMDLCHEKFKLQMHPGEKLDELQANLLSNLDHSLTFNLLSGDMIQPGSTEKEKVVSLYAWCSEVLVDAATKAFYGKALYEVAPNLLPEFLIFDDEAWKLYSKYPEFAAKKMFRYKAKVQSAFERYVDLPKEQRQDASWLIKNIEESLVELDVTETSQLAPNLFLLHRLLNTNAYKQCFWCLAYLLHDQQLLQAVKAEIQPAFQADGQLNLDYLLDNGPLINSLYEENLRLCNAPIGARQVMSKFALGGKVLKTGNMLLMPYRQLHFNEQVFGTNATEFDAKRFLKDKNLLRSTSYRPFGGGSTYCPGRFLAKREVLMFVALVLFRFDISLVGKDGEKAKFPRMDVTIPLGGVMGPVVGDDIIMEVRPVKS
ncbi:cytochrome P450, partial [Mollisia scopiformis]